MKVWPRPWPAPRPDDELVETATALLEPGAAELRLSLRSLKELEGLTAAPVDDSTGTGFNDIPLGSSSEDLVPRTDFGSTEDLVPSATIGDLDDSVNADLSEVFGDTSVNTDSDDGNELPFTFE